MDDEEARPVLGQRHQLRNRALDETPLEGEGQPAARRTHGVAAQRDDEQRP